MRADDPACLAPESGHGAWPARLELGFACAEGRTVLTRRLHEGPLRVQKPLYPEGEGCCHAIVLHPPSGIAGGDVLEIDVSLGEGAQALLTTPGAGKWYRAGGAAAAQTVRLQVGAGGTAEWLPQESIVFDGALARMRTHVTLAPGARYVGLETLCLGRRARGERFTQGELRLATDITLAGRPLWRERGILAGGSPLLDSPIGLAGNTLSSTALFAGMDVDAETLAAARALHPSEAGAQCAVTRLPQLLVGRYLGHSTEAARAWFLALWAVLRPAMAGRPARMPRLWAT